MEFPNALACVEKFEKENPEILPKINVAIKNYLNRITQTPPMEIPDVQPFAEVFRIENFTIPSKIATFIMNNSRNPGYLLKIIDDCTNDDYWMHYEVIKIHSVKFYDRVKTLFNSSNTYITDEFDLFGLVRKYMYTGLLEIPRSKLIELNSFVETLDLDTLMEDIATNIEFESVDELIKFLEKASIAKNPFMIKKCVDQFIDMFNSIPLEKVFLALPYFNRTTMERLFMSVHVHFGVESELKLAKTFKEWIKMMNDNDESENDPNDWIPLEHVKFEVFDFNTLIEEIRPLEILTDKEYIWFLEQKAKEAVKKSNIDENKFYVCNSNEKIPEGFRAVTDAEFETKDFRERFLNKINSPLEFISTTKCKYLITNSNRGIGFKTDRSNGAWLTLNQDIPSSNRIMNAEEILSIDHFVLYGIAYATPFGIGYLCVKC